MKRVGWIAGTTLGGLALAGAVVAPGLSARETRPSHAPAAALFGSFTPASADPKLAAILASNGLDGDGFRFTPSDANTTSKPGVTVAIRAKRVTGHSDSPQQTASATPDMTIAPITYDLAVAAGWKHFAVGGDVTKVDLAGTPGSRKKTEVGVSYSTSKFSGSLTAGSDVPDDDVPASLRDEPSYSIDVGGSYSIAHNIDLTAGVRYRSQKNRLPAVSDDPRRDSQAVYVGTAFRF